MENPPNILYHYTNQRGLLGILESKSIWATKIQYLNDSSEFQLALELASSVLQKLTDGEKSVKKRRKIEALQRNLREIKYLNVCVCSLSAHNDMLSQWRAYAGGSAGYAIGLDRSSLTLQAAKQGFDLVQCIYDPRTQKEMVECLVVESLEKEFNTMPTRVDRSRPRTIEVLAVGGDFGSHFAQLAPKIKSHAFHEESEWRLVSARGIDGGRLSFRPGISMITPYLPFSLGEPNDSCLSSITVGPSPHPELSKISTTMLVAKAGWKSPVEIHATKTPYRIW